MSRTKAIWFKVVVFLIVVAVIIFLHYFKILQPIEGMITTVFKPLQVPLYRLSLTLSDQEFLQEKEDLIQQNNDLENKVNELIGKNTELKSLIDKNEVLGEQMNFLQDNELQSQPVKIVSRFSENNTQIITVNQGGNKNIKPGMAVIAGEGILIGKVLEVEVNTSKILLVTSNLSQIAVQIENDQNTPGLVKGQHGLSLVMKLIPKQDEIKSGDIVITSGVEEMIPKGLIIGEIDSVEDKAGDLFKSAKLIPLIDYSRLSIVSIVML